jgi:hypothetical protein
MESWLQAVAKQSRSLGCKQWQSNQGVSAASIGQASKESCPEALAEQRRKPSKRTLAIVQHSQRARPQKAQIRRDHGQANECCVLYHLRVYKNNRMDWWPKGKGDGRAWRNSHDDCGGLRSNAVNWANQISQQGGGRTRCNRRGGAGKKGH